MYKLFLYLSLRAFFFATTLRRNPTWISLLCLQHGPMLVSPQPLKEIQPGFPCSAFSMVPCLTPGRVKMGAMIIPLLLRQQHLKQVSDIFASVIAIIYPLTPA